MKKLNNDKILNVVTASILLFLAIGVGFICFIPSETVTMTEGKSYSPIYYGNRNSNKVALMFNVYEGKENVSEILKILNRHNAKATFFIGGCYAEDNSEMLTEILDAGCELGNHGYFHKDHSKIDEQRNKDEIESTGKLIARYTGYEVTLFAPPSGAFSVKTLKVAENLSYKTILWSKDTIDWRDNNVKLVYNRATKNISGGDFVLMHPKAHTVSALDDILTYYKSVGLIATTVSDCME